VATQDEDAEFPSCRSLNPEGHGSSDSLPHPDAARLDRIPLAAHRSHALQTNANWDFAELGPKEKGGVT
jgi:hypothetical protein